MLASTGGSVWRSTGHLSSSVQIMKKVWESDGKFALIGRPRAMAVLSTISSSNGGYSCLVFARYTDSVPAAPPQTVCVGSTQWCPSVPECRRRTGGGESLISSLVIGGKLTFQNWTSELKKCFSRLFQVFDATNTTRERRGTIVKFAEQNGFKVR